MCKSRLLLNDMPVCHENLLKIPCGRIIVTNGKISFAFFVLLRRRTEVCCSVGELNFSQDFMDERSGITSVTESLFKVLFVLTKTLLD